MLGQNIASIERYPRRIVQGLWGVPNIHARQKWITVWSILETLPEKGLNILDAGCGPGLWPLEIAARRPDWKITGIDLDSKVIETAQIRRRKIRLDNVRFQKADFLSFEEEGKYDVVMSLFSADSSVALGRGDDLFSQFHKWLKPGGMLILLLRRRHAETPCVSWLPSRHRQKVFSREEIVAFCDRHGFSIKQLAGRVGRLGTFAKQLDLAVNGNLGKLSMLCYPISCSLIRLDHAFSGGSDGASLWWALIAHKSESLYQSSEERPAGLVETQAAG